MKGKKYDAAFKREAVKQVKEQGKGVFDVAEELGIHIKTMYRWIDEYKQDGVSAFPCKGILKPDDAELRRLKREIEDLREKMKS
jgi:transposase